MKKTLSLFILLFIFSCTNSGGSALKPNDNSNVHSDISIIDTLSKEVEKNKGIITGTYYGELQVTLSTDGKESQVIDSRGVTMIFNSNGTIYSEIFDNDLIPAGILQKKSDNIYYGVYTHRSIDCVYTIKIQIVSDSIISVNIMSRQISSGEDTITYVGELSRE